MVPDHHVAEEQSSGDEGFLCRAGGLLHDVDILKSRAVARRPSVTRLTQS